MQLCGHWALLREISMAVTKIINNTQEFEMQKSASTQIGVLCRSLSIILKTQVQ